MKLVLFACHASALTAIIVGNAAAQTESRSATVYRCGADGRELRDSPCPNNPNASAKQVEYDHPSAAQTRAASERATAEANRGRALEAKRLQDEAEARRRASHAVGINGLAGPAAAARPASSPRQPLPPKAPKAPKLAKPHKPALSPATLPGGSASSPR